MYLIKLNYIILNLFDTISLLELLVRIQQHLFKLYSTNSKNMIANIDHDKRFNVYDRRINQEIILCRYYNYI